MLFESRSFWHPKDLRSVADYEDAYQIREEGIVAIADGVSSAIFSRQWADLLTQEIVRNPPDLTDAEAFRQWLAELRVAWRDSIDLTKLSWMQKQKLQQVGGAYSTLLWVELYPEPNEGEETSVRYRMRCFALGDCCLFHVRGGELLRKFPLESVAEFEMDPNTICSVDRKLDHYLEFQQIDDFCQEGDLLVLSTDALAKCIYQQLEANEPVDWDALWNLDPERWYDEVAARRNLSSDRCMRVDDTTLVMLRMLGKATVAEEAPDPNNEATLAATVDEIEVDTPLDSFPMLSTDALQETPEPTESNPDAK